MGDSSESVGMKSSLTTGSDAKATSGSGSGGTYGVSPSGAAGGMSSGSGGTYTAGYAANSSSTAGWESSRRTLFSSLPGLPPSLMGQASPKEELLS
jgi:hypothetical protein